MVTAILDTNVFIRAALRPRSPSARVVDAYLDGEFQLALENQSYAAQALAAFDWETINACDERVCWRPARWCDGDLRRPDIQADGGCSKSYPRRSRKQDRRCL